MTATPWWDSSGSVIMREPMCRNLARKPGARVVAFDARSAPLTLLAADGVQAAPSPDEEARRAEIISLCGRESRRCGASRSAQRAGMGSSPRSVAARRGDANERQASPVATLLRAPSTG